MATVATAPSIASLLSTLTASLESATTVLPDDSSAATITLHTDGGPSLLNVKNELLLAYVQNLVFLLLLKIRGLRDAQKIQSGDGKTDYETNSMQEAAVKRLVELRVYLEKGVKPIENKLQFQLDKVIRAVEDAEAVTARKPKVSARLREAQKAGGDVEDEDVEDDQDDDDEDGNSEMDTATGGVRIGQYLSNESFGPNAAKLDRPESSTSTGLSHPDAREPSSSSTAVYRPPRVAPMLPPEMRSSKEQEERRQRRPNKSATLDEFVADELTDAPVAEPSIGSTIVRGGRAVRSARERQEDEERRVYEEANFVRLPQSSGKKAEQKSRKEKRDGFGGEEWRELVDGVDRIARLTRKGGSAGGAAGALERSRKRKAAEGGGGGGDAMGDVWGRKKQQFARRQRR